MQIFEKSAHFKNLHISRKVGFSRPTCSQAVQILKKRWSYRTTTFVLKNIISYSNRRQLQQPLHHCVTKTPMFCADFVQILCRFFKNLHICADFSYDHADWTHLFFRTRKIILQTLISSTPVLRSHRCSKNRVFSTRNSSPKSRRSRNINLYSKYL